MSIERVTVIGAGTMGSQIALQVARSGRHQVVLFDTSGAQLDAAMAQAGKMLRRWVERADMTEAGAAAVLGAVRTSASLPEAVASSDLVIEAVYESMDAKREVFEVADRAAPTGAILASNSSTIAISRLAQATGRPDRCCNLHFFHPVTVMELCEVGAGPQTSAATLEAALEFVRDIGRTPVVLRKEVHGFIVNRILFAAAEEALRLFEGGYADMKDIDTAVKKGLNWPMGPFQLLDFSGIDVIYSALLDRQRLGEGPPPSPLLKEMVDAGQLGRKSGRGFYDYQPTS